MTKKNKMLIVLGILTLVITISGVTYAFFQYVKTGAVNTIKAGKIRFSFTEGNTIDLENLFPITRKEAINDESNNSTCEIVINGYSTYEKGVEYRVSAIDTHLSINRNDKPVEVPVSVIVNVEANGEGANDNLGTEDDNYFSNRDEYTTSHYKKLAKSTITENQMLLVGYIARNESNTNNSINGKITIKAFFDDDKMHISDTPNDLDEEDMDKVVLSTSEWQSINEVGASFKLSVEAKEGIWIDTPLYEIMQQGAVLDNIQSSFVSSSSGIDFSKPSGDTDNDNVIDNGKGLYKMASTKNNDYPIVYYRGDVDDNNVVFANKCWKMVRTTDTGGVKLLYNGEYSTKYTTTPLQNESDYTIATNSGNTFTWNDTTKTFDVSIQNTTVTELSFTVPEDDNYILEVVETTGPLGYGTIDIYNGIDLVKSYYGGFGGPTKISHEFGSLTASDIIKVTFTAVQASDVNYINLSVKMTKKGNSLGIDCNNLPADTGINIGAQTGFSFGTADQKLNSLAYVGYMYGTVYPIVWSTTADNIVFGKGFVYENNRYKLIETDVGDALTRHYTCNLTDANGICESIRYYPFAGTTDYYYLVLSNGKSIEDAIFEMQANTSNSNAKTIIDSWYATNIATSANNSNKIEDTIWCNDRGFSDLGGYNPNGNGSTTWILYSAYQRLKIDNTPSLKCANKNDSFTVSSAKGNRNLTYPVALLTADELTLAGAKVTIASSIYANSGTTFYSMTPYGVGGPNARVLTLGSDGVVGYNSVNHPYSLRPSLSLKNGVGFSTGTGTVNDPYIIVE